jgi:hypothetical protein
MKSVTDRLIFGPSRCSKLAPTGLSNRFDHDLGHLPASIACRAVTEIGQRPGSQMQNMIREFESTSLGQLEGINHQVVALR